jgi:predicted transcriptional regulator
MTAMVLAPPRQRRSPELIVSEIIRAALPGVRKTRLMYASSLNVKQLNKYLEAMLEADLLSYDPSNNTYLATERAVAYLKTLADFYKTEEKLERKWTELRGLLRA